MTRQVGRTRRSETFPPSPLGGEGLGVRGLGLHPPPPAPPPPPGGRGVGGGGAWTSPLTPGPSPPRGEGRLRRACGERGGPRRAGQLGAAGAAGNRAGGGGVRPLRGQHLPGRPPPVGRRGA